MVTVSVITDKVPSAYKGFGDTLMRGFFIIYFDIRPLLKKKSTFSEILTEVIQTMEFVGEDIPDDEARKVLEYLYNNNCFIGELEDKLLFVVEEGEKFLAFFEKILVKALKREVSDLIRKHRDKSAQFGSSSS